MTTFVRVVDELGNQITVPDTDPLLADGTYTPLPGHPAVDRYGTALPPVPGVHNRAGEPLRGQELTDALKTAALSTHGTVAQKQARLAEHTASVEASHPTTSKE